MVYVRAVHFAATILAAGVVIFQFLVAEQAFRSAIGERARRSFICIRSKAWPTVTIMTGHVGHASASVRLWDDDFDPLKAEALTFALTAPAAGASAVARVRRRVVARRKLDDDA